MLARLRHCLAAGALVVPSFIIASVLLPLDVATKPQDLWIPLGPPSEYIQTLAIDPQHPTTLFAGTTDRGLYKSTDGGGSWQAVKGDLAGQWVRAFAIDPRTPTVVYAGVLTSSSNQRGGLFKSTDAGETWRALKLLGPAADSGIYALGIDPKNPTTLYAATGYAARGLDNYKSTDGGETWLTITDPIGVTGFGIDPQTPTTLYMVSRYGVFKSTDGGITSQAINNGLSDPNVPANDIRDLAIDPHTSTTLYVSTEGRGVFKSMNGGANWRPINTGLSDRRVNALAIDPQTPTTIYAATWHGVFKSIDGGRRWSAISDGLADLSAVALVIDPTSPTTVYTGTFGNGVFVSSATSGLSTRPQVEPAGDRGSVTHAASDVDGSLWLAMEVRGELPIYAGSRKTFLYRRSPAQREWQKMLEVAGQGTIKRMWFFGSGRVSIWVDGRGDASGLIMHTSDGGTRWRASPMLGKFVIDVSFINPTEGWMLVALGWGMNHEWPALYHTLDGGDHWTLIAGDPTNPDRIYVSGLGTVHKSGMTFIDAKTGWVGTADFVAMHGQLLVSRDGGATWKVQTITPPRGTPDDALPIVLPPRFFGAGIAVAAAPSGSFSYVYASSDGGRSWGNPRKVPVGRGSNDFVPLDFLSPTTWAAASNQALWLSSNAGKSWIQRIIPLSRGYRVERIVLASPTHVWFYGSTIIPSSRLTRMGSRGRTADYLLETSDAGVHWMRVALPQPR